MRVCIYIYICVCMRVYSFVYLWYEMQISHMYDITSTRANHWILWENSKGGMCVRAKLRQPKPTEHRLVKLGQAVQPSPRRLSLQTNLRRKSNTWQIVRKQRTLVETIARFSFFFGWSVVWQRKIRTNINHVSDQLFVQVLLLIWSGISNLIKFHSAHHNPLNCVYRRTMLALRSVILLLATA